MKVHRTKLKRIRQLLLLACSCPVIYVEHTNACLDALCELDELLGITDTSAKECFYGAPLKLQIKDKEE